MFNVQLLILDVSGFIFSTVQLYCIKTRWSSGLVFLYLFIILSPPDNRGTLSEMAYSFSCSRARIPLRRLTTPTQRPNAALGESSCETNKVERGTPRTNSSHSNSCIPASRHFNSGSADPYRNLHHEVEEEQPSSQAADPRDSVSRKPLLRPQWKPIKK